MVKAQSLGAVQGRHAQHIRDGAFSGAAAFVLGEQRR